MSEQPKCADRPLLRIVSQEIDLGEQSESLTSRHGLSPHMSLCEFTEAYVLPVWLKGKQASPETLVSYRESLKYWKQFTEDPQLVQIDDFTIEKFVSGLWTIPGRKAPTVSAYTVKKHCGQVQTCLYLAGPKTKEHKKAQELLDRVPWIEKPEVEWLPPDGDFTLEEIGKILDACDSMVRPTFPGITPPAWWRALIVVAYNTAERRGALLAATFADLDLEKRTIRFPRLSRKGKHKSHTVPLNDAALAAIESIRTPRSTIFPWKNWPRSKRWFHENWVRLVKAAGIPPERRFGLHGLRKTTATATGGVSPLAAQLLLGHSSFAVTQQHYVNHQRILADAVQALPQPPQAHSKRRKGDDPRQMLLFD